MSLIVRKRHSFLYLKILRQKIVPVEEKRGEQTQQVRFTQAYSRLLGAVYRIAEILVTYQQLSVCISKHKDFLIQFQEV